MPGYTPGKPGRYPAKLAGYLAVRSIRAQHLAPHGGGDLG